jgi:membrane-associated phospholipid phosphatase
MRKNIYILFSFALAISACTQNNTVTIDYSSGALIASWEDNLTEAVMVDMFPPPVASRIYAYSNIALYESLRHTDSAQRKSLAGILNGFDSLPQPDSALQYDFRLVALTAFSEVSASVVYTKQIIRDHEKRVSDSLKLVLHDDAVFQRSVAYGKQLGGAIVSYASKDNFKLTRGMVRYTLLHEAGSWEPTPPDYLPGAEPHWSKIRTFVLDSAAQFLPDTLPVAFSTNPQSAFFKNAKAVIDAASALDSNQISMAAFWDDNPGVSSVYGHMKHIRKKMTPGGHWMAVIGQLVRKDSLNMSASSTIYALTSIAVADAFFASWDAKYRYQTIRPITYIHRHITDDWQPLLQTPPFPEFPSGHATISAAAATVLTGLAGDNYSYTDSTEYRFGLPVRSFSSFMHAATECAESRFYGGIHFMPSNESGTAIGVKVGDAVLVKTKFSENN